MSTNTKTNTKRNRNRNLPPHPPARDLLPLINASAEVARWLDHYWAKLKLPLAEQRRLAITISRSEFHQWTGRRLNPLALGCYCYLPHANGNGALADVALDATASLHAAPAVAAPGADTAVSSRVQPALPGFADASAPPAAMQDIAIAPAAIAHTTNAPEEQDYRHLIFVEPDLLPLGVEVTVAHELIHLSDRVQGNPRKHHCHGYDSISLDEAAITGRDPELLRALLREETARREAALRERRPYRYLYVCPHCNKEYPRVRRYTRPVSCGRCDQHYNPAFLLRMREPVEVAATPASAQSDGDDVSWTA